MPTIDAANDPQADPTASPAERRTEIAGRLPELLGRAREALLQAGLTTPIFLVVPASGEAIVTLGSTANPDPTDEEWKRVGDVVCEVLRGMLKTRKLIHREVPCASA